jgi:hypothetical protein
MGPSGNSAAPKTAKSNKDGRFGTNGGNGGYQRRQKLDAGFDKPLKLNPAGKFAATGKTERR